MKTYFLSLSKALYKTRFKDLVAPTKILNILKYLLKSFSEDIEIPLDNDISDIDDELEDFLDKVNYTLSSDSTTIVS